MLLGVAVGMGRGSFQRIVRPQTVRFNLAVFILLLVSAAFKEWMASLSIYLGRVINSTTLFADAWHHRSDAIATVLVAVGLVVSPLGFFRLDGVLGLAVTALLLWVSWDLSRNLGQRADRQGGPTRGRSRSSARSPAPSPTSSPATVSPSTTTPAGPRPPCTSSSRSG